MIDGANVLLVVLDLRLSKSTHNFKYCRIQFIEKMCRCKRHDIQKGDILNNMCKYPDIRCRNWQRKTNIFVNHKTWIHRVDELHSDYDIGGWWEFQCVDKLRWTLSRIKVNYWYALEYYNYKFVFLQFCQMEWFSRQRKYFTIR